MKRFILSLSAMVIILVIAVSCSKDEDNNGLPVVGNADLNGKKMELTYAILGGLHTYPPVWPSRYAFMLAGKMSVAGNLIQEPYLFGYIEVLPEPGTELTFDLNKDDISLRCILKSKEYRQHPTGKALPIASGILTLQRSTNDIFHLEFDIRTEGGNVLSGTSKLNYIP